MATEVLYATSHLAGDFLNPGNAVGDGSNGLWAGQLDTNVSSTSRWAIGDPVDPLASGATQTIRVTARKGSNSGVPTIQLNLYESGALVSTILAATNVTATGSQTLTGTFDSSAIANRANVEIEVVQTAAGGSPAARNSAQIGRIEWTAETGVAEPTPKADTLVYDFGTDDGTFVDAVAGGSISGGVASMPYTTGSTVKQTPIDYDLTSSTVFVECVHNAGHASNESRFAFGQGGGLFGPNQFHFIIVSTSLFMREYTAIGSNELEIVYNATTMRWLRFRHSGSTIFWDTSPDGVTWTQRRSKATTFTPSAHRIILGGFNFTANQATGATFDNLNGAAGEPVEQLGTSLPLATGLSAGFSVPTATVEQLGTVLAVETGASAGLDVPAATVAQLGTTLPVETDWSAGLATVVPTPPQLSTALPLQTNWVAGLSVPTPTVEQLGTAVPLETGITAGLSVPTPSVSQLGTLLPLITDLAPVLGVPLTGDFPGDPGAGVVLSGCTVWSGSAGVASGIDWMDTATGRRHVLSRTYSSNGDGWDWTQIDDDLAVDRIPFHTSKFTNFTLAQIVAGTADTALTTQANNAIARASSPIWLGFYHEPEDNFESDVDAAQFRDAARYIVDFMRTAGVTNVAWIFPVWMTSWSFRGGEAVRGPAYKWDIDWKGTLSGAGVPNATDWWTGTDAMTDLIGMDQYTPWIGGTTYNTFDSDVGYSANRLFTEWGRPVKPIAIGECGTKDDATPTPDWGVHFAELLESCVANDVRGLVYYNTDNNNFVNADPGGERFAGYNAMIADTRVGDVDVPGVPAEGEGPAAPTYFGGNVGGGGGLISHTVAWPAGVQAGDFAVLSWVYSITQTHVLPAGFTLVEVFDGDSGSHRTGLFTRICDGTESGNVTLELSGITKQSATLTVYRGLHATAPLDTYARHNATGTTVHNCPSVTTGFADCFAATIYSERVTDATANAAIASPYVERADTGGISSAGGGGTMIAFADEGVLEVTRPAATVVTPPDWTGTTSTANVITWTLSLRPAEVAEPIGQLATAIPLETGITAGLSVPTPTVPQLGTALALETGIAAGLTAPTPSVQQIATAIPIETDLTAGLSVPAATVEQLGTALPLETGISAGLAQPAGSIPQLAAPFALETGISPGLSVPTPTVEQLGTAIDVETGISAGLNVPTPTVPALATSVPLETGIAAGLSPPVTIEFPLYLPLLVTAIPSLAVTTEYDLATVTELDELAVTTDLEDLATATAVDMPETVTEIPDVAVTTELPALAVATVLEGTHAAP